MTVKATCSSRSPSTIGSDMTEDEFMRAALNAFPLAMIGQDNDGQLIVYTNLTLRNGEVVEVDDPNTTGV